MDLNTNNTRTKTFYAALMLAVFSLPLLTGIDGCNSSQWTAIATDPDMNQTNPKETQEIAMELNTNKEKKSTKSLVRREVAMFGAGCFWGVEAAFQRLPGVLDTTVGYSGGHVDNPTYKQVCTDRTGHAEVIRIEYDPTKIPYEHLLNIFWRSHDPTQLNRQGPDIGKQYRSVIFYFSEEQKMAAEASKERVAKLNTYHNKTIVTQIEPANTFWRAEEYHQKYLQKRGLENCHL